MHAPLVVMLRFPISTCSRLHMSRVWRMLADLNQMTSIFHLLGTPSELDIEHFSSAEARAWIATQPSRSRMHFASKLPAAPAEAVDLLEQMLVLDPEKRLSAEEALHHPYFAPLFHTEMDATAIESPTKAAAQLLDLERFEKPLTLSELKVLLWNEIRDLHPDLMPAPSCVANV